MFVFPKAHHFGYPGTVPRGIRSPKTTALLTGIGSPSPMNIFVFFALLLEAEVTETVMLHQKNIHQYRCISIHKSCHVSVYV